MTNTTAAVATTKTRAKQHDAHIQARAKIIRRVMQRDREWGSKKHWMTEEQIAMCVANHKWRPSDFMIFVGRYSSFNKNTQRQVMAKDIPNGVIHAIMCGA